MRNVSARMAKASYDYNRNVFINCPFDNEYNYIFEALVFAVFECGLRPRCALEVSDANEVSLREDRAYHK